MKKCEVSSLAGYRQENTIILTSCERAIHSIQSKESRPNCYFVDVIS